MVRRIQHDSIDLHRRSACVQRGEYAFGPTARRGWALAFSDGVEAHYFAWGCFSQFWVLLSDPPRPGHGAVNASRRVPKMFGIAICCSKPDSTPIIRILPPTCAASIDCCRVSP